MQIQLLKFPVVPTHGGDVANYTYAVLYGPLTHHMCLRTLMVHSQTVRTHTGAPALLPSDDRACQGGQYSHGLQGLPAEGGAHGVSQGAREAPLDTSVWGCGCGCGWGGRV